MLSENIANEIGSALDREFPVKAKQVDSKQAPTVSQDIEALKARFDKDVEALKQKLDLILKGIGMLRGQL